ncbi:MAG: HEAT repeat domain-containing protein [Acidobacteriota bacterium]|nr:HEAT repeat domain-containing protein [Acidobacteriota bacterium]
MNDARKFGHADAPCDAWQPLRSLAVGGELDPADESRLAPHLAECAACSADLARERETLALLVAQRAEPGAALLASCRAGLQDALDREEDRGWIARFLGPLLPSSWISPRPAWSAAILLLIGFSVGLFVPRLLLRNRAAHPPQNPPSHVASTPAPLLLAHSPYADSHKAPDSAAQQNSSDSSAAASASPVQALDLHRATVASINVLPTGAGVPPQVQLQLAAQQPYTLQGTVDDGDVRDVLLYVLRHGELFAPVIRLSAVDALSPRSGIPEIHSALSRAMRQDASAAVRLKALQALSSPGPEDLVARMLLDAISSDQDPIVREQAMDTLRNLADSGQLAPTDHVIAVLRNFAHDDADPSIRMQSAAVVRELVSQRNASR